MLTIEEISDRIEITDLLFHNAEACDRQDWDAWASAFTDDAIIDYTEMGGARQNLKEAKAFLERVLPTFKGYQHLLGNTVVKVDGDTARARSICHNPMVVGRGDGTEAVFVNGLWYRDDLVRTPDGWRITLRHQERCFVDRRPDDLQRPEATTS